MTERRLPVVGGPARAEPEETLDEARPPYPRRAAAVIAAREGIDVTPFAEALEDAARAAGIDLELVGPHVVRTHRAWLTVVVTAGLPQVAWNAFARAVAGEADLVLADPRPGVARALFEAR